LARPAENPPGSGRGETERRITSGDSHGRAMSQDPDKTIRFAGPLANGRRGRWDARSCGGGVAGGGWFTVARPLPLASSPLLVNQVAGGGGSPARWPVRGWQFCPTLFALHPVGGSAGRYKPIAAEEAKERQRQAGGDRTTRKGKARGSAGGKNATSAKARDAAGEKFGVSGKTVDAAEKPRAGFPPKNRGFGDDRGGKGRIRPRGSPPDSSCTRVQNWEPRPRAGTFEMSTRVEKLSWGPRPRGCDAEPSQYGVLDT